MPTVVWVHQIYKPQSFVTILDQLSIFFLILHFDQTRFTRIVMYSQPSLSRSRRDLLNHFEISVLWHIRSAELRKLQIKIQTNFTKNKYVIWLILLEIYIENIVEKGRNCSSGAISPFIHNILLLMLDFCIKTKTRFLFALAVIRDNRSRDNDSRLYLVKVFAIATAFQEFTLIVKCCYFTSTFLCTQPSFDKL